MTIVLVLLVIVIAIIAGLVGFTWNTTRKIEAAFPPRGQFIEIDGQRLHYVEKGSGPPLVLIHGMSGNLCHFTYALVDRLANDFRVIALDRPGSGYSTRPTDASAALGAQAVTVTKFIAALKLERPMLVGHSLGGALSLTCAVNHPDSVSALALIAPLTQAVEIIPDVFKGLEVSSPLLRRIIGWTVATPIGILGGKNILANAFGPDTAPADFPTRGGGILGLRPSGYISASEDMMAINDDLPQTMTRYSSLTLPIGLIFGKGDQLLDYRAQGEAMKATVPAIDFVLMEGGHMLLITAPDACADLIRRTAKRRG
jgi:pimeloyl-ACP methyl ester carboxylesterase